MSGAAHDARVLDRLAGPAPAENRRLGLPLRRDRDTPQTAYRAAILTACRP